MKLASDTKLDDSLYLWFAQMPTPPVIQRKVIACDIEEVAIPSHGEVLDMSEEQQPETSVAHLFIYKNEMATAKRSSSNFFMFDDTHK